MTGTSMRKTLLGEYPQRWHHQSPSCSRPGVSCNIWVIVNIFFQWLWDFVQWVAIFWEGDKKYIVLESLDSLLSSCQIESRSREVELALLVHESRVGNHCRRISWLKSGDSSSVKQWIAINTAKNWQLRESEGMCAGAGGMPLQVVLCWLEFPIAPLAPFILGEVSVRICGV